MAGQFCHVFRLNFEFLLFVIVCQTLNFKQMTWALKLAAVCDIYYQHHSTATYTVLW